MSFESMSAENRSALNFQICCSFCRRRGHRLPNCNDERLNDFERRCVEFINNEFVEVRFRNFLLDQAIIDPQLIKAYAIKKCGSTTRHQIDRCIQNIINYFSPIDERNNQTLESETHLQVIQNSSQRTMIQNSILETMIDLFSTYSLPNTSDVQRNQLILQLQDYTLFIQAVNETGIFEFIADKKFNINTNLLDCRENLEENCECNICYENYEKTNFIELNCKHEFCKECIKKSLINETKDVPLCSLCRTEIVSFGIRKEIIKDEFIDLII